MRSTWSSNGCSSPGFIKRRLPPPEVTPSGVVFRFNAPSAKVVQLAGDWPENNWLRGQAQTSTVLVGEMRDDDQDGIWERLEKLPTGRYQYKFVITTASRGRKTRTTRTVPTTGRAGSTRCSTSDDAARTKGLSMTRRPLLRLAALVALAAQAGCEANQPGTILTPSGRKPVPANSSITGRLEFGDGTYPQTLVLVAPVLEPGCVSAYTKIGISGTLVAAGFVPTAAPQYYTYRGN